MENDENQETVDIEKFRVKELPDTVFYLPNFITPSEETILLDLISRSAKTKWTQLRNRRLQNWGGIPHLKGMIPEDMPKWIQELISKIMTVGKINFEGRQPNHVLLNEYLPGQGISPHLDGDLFFPSIATLSLGSHTVLNYYRKSEDSDLVFDPFGDRLESSLLILPRSLLLVKGKMYTDYLHGINEIEADTLDESLIQPEGMNGIPTNATVQRSKRISLTFRHVPKTAKFKLKF